MSEQRIPPPWAVAEAKRNPNGHVYEIHGNWDPDGAIPGYAVFGAWKVDADGNIVGDFIQNPHYRPMGPNDGPPDQLVAPKEWKRPRH